MCINVSCCIFVGFAVSHIDIEDRFLKRGSHCLPTYIVLLKFCLLRPL